MKSKSIAWSIALAGVGAVLSLKDADWLGDPSPYTLGVLALGFLVGGTLGACIAQIVKPIRREKDRVSKFILWVSAFAILGFVLGHGNVPWTTTLRITGYSIVVGVVVGSMHYLLTKSSSQN